MSVQPNIRKSGKIRKTASGNGKIVKHATPKAGKINPHA